MLVTRTRGRSSMEISCAFPTTLESHEHIALAEELGFERAWLYDTPQQSPRRLDDARAGGGADGAHRARPRRAGAEPAPPDGQRGGDGGAGGPRARPRRGGVRDGLHRPAGDGLPRDSVEVHGRLRPRLPGPAGGETI